MYRLAHSSTVVSTRASQGREGRLPGVALAVAGAIAFSGKAIIVKPGDRYGADAITLIAPRMAVALPFFAFVAWLSSRRVGGRPLAWADRWRIGVVGFLGDDLASDLDFLGLEYVAASLGRLSLYLNPTLVLAIGMVFFGRRASGRQVVARLLGYGGVAGPHRPGWSPRTRLTHRPEIRPLKRSWK